MNVKEFSSELLSSLVHKACRSTRNRQHLNIHLNYEDRCQRLFNAITVDSYIRPHRHSLDPKTEDLIAIRGVFALVVFGGAGAIEKIIRFGTEKYADTADLSIGVELSPGAWHTVVALTEGAILLEVKEGPFLPDAAKELAPWAPDEGTLEAARYIQSLRSAIERWSERSAEASNAMVA
jgi:cupin fold WbuC family metalloprotein